MLAVRQMLPSVTATSVVVALSRPGMKFRLVVPFGPPAQACTATLPRALMLRTESLTITPFVVAGTPASAFTFTVVT